MVIIIITQANAFGQKLTIKDKDSGRPLNLVSLSSANPLASATTNTRGQVDISDFKGSDAIEFRLLGYQGITLSYNALKELDFTIALSQSLFRWMRLWFLLHDGNKTNVRFLIRSLP